MTAEEWVMQSGKVQALLADAEGVAAFLLPGWTPCALFAPTARGLLLLVNDARPTGSVLNFRCTAPNTVGKRRWNGTVIAEDGTFCKFKAFKPTVNARWYQRAELQDFTPPRP